MNYARTVAVSPLLDMIANYEHMSRSMVNAAYKPIITLPLLAYLLRHRRALAEGDTPKSFLRDVLPALCAARCSHGSQDSLARHPSRPTPIPPATHLARHPSALPPPSRAPPSRARLGARIGHRVVTPSVIPPPDDCVLLPMIAF